MPDDLTRQADDGQGDIIKCLEQPLRGRVSDTLLRIVGDQADELLLVRLELAADDELDQGQEAYGDAQ